MLDLRFKVTLIVVFLMLILLGLTFNVKSSQALISIPLIYEHEGTHYKIGHVTIQVIPDYEYNCATVHIILDVDYDVHIKVLKVYDEISGIEYTIAEDKHFPKDNMAVNIINVAYEIVKTVEIREGEGRNKTYHVADIRIRVYGYWSPESEYRIYGKKTWWRYFEAYINPSFRIPAFEVEYWRNKYCNLKDKYDALQLEYFKLKGKYVGLKEEYEKLNTTYNMLVERYNRLLEDYATVENKLRTLYESLNRVRLENKILYAIIVILSLALLSLAYKL